MLPFSLNRLSADDGLTLIARGVMTVLWSHKDGHTTSAVEMARQLGCGRKYVADGLAALVGLRWLVVQEVRYSDNPNRVVARRYHLAMERVFTDEEVVEFSQPILLDRKRAATPLLSDPVTLGSDGDPGPERTRGAGPDANRDPGPERTTSLDEGLDQQLDGGAARRRTRARARTLIRDNIPGTGRYLSSELELLTTMTARMLADPACCQQAVGLALQEWDLRDDLGPRALPELVSDVLKVYPQLRPPRTHADVP